MRKFLVYDLPTRFFHWTFAALFLGAFVIAKSMDEDSALFPFHMMMGLTLGFTTVLRVVWGVAGTKHAKFSDFSLAPKELLNYFKGILSRSKVVWAGHNPASSWSAIIMMILALSLGGTGYLMTSGVNKEDIAEIHELLANGFIIVVVLHILGIALHSLRHRDWIGLSMLDGKKAQLKNEDVIPKTHGGLATLFVILVLAFGVNLFRSYNPTVKTLSFAGKTLQLGEEEEAGDK